jgi:hypothetical protein
LRQVDRVVDADGGEDILEFVDESVWGHMSVPDGDAQSERVRAGSGAYLISPGSEMPPGVTSDPEADSAVIFAVCMAA